jgi:hypothetical protein
MTRLTGTVLLGLIFLTPACGSKEAGAGSIAGRITKVCTTTSNLPPAVCACVGDEATRQLSASAQRLFVALLEKDEQALQAARQNISVEDATAAGTFMVRASATCAAQQSKEPQRP